MEGSKGAALPSSPLTPDSFLFSPRSGENYRSSGCESLRQALQFTIVMPGLVPSIDVLRGVAGKPWLAEVSPGSVGLLSVFLGVAPEAQAAMKKITNKAQDTKRKNFFSATSASPW
jgi:hypothetical protein